MSYEARSFEAVSNNSEMRLRRYLSIEELSTARHIVQKTAEHLADVATHHSGADAGLDAEIAPLRSARAHGHAPRGADVDAIRAALGVTEADVRALYTIGQTFTENYNKTNGDQLTPAQGREIMLSLLGVYQVTSYAENEGAARHAERQRRELIAQIQTHETITPEEVFWSKMDEEAFSAWMGFDDGSGYARLENNRWFEIAYKGTDGSYREAEFDLATAPPKIDGERIDDPAMLLNLINRTGALRLHSSISIAHSYGAEAAQMAWEHVSAEMRRLNRDKISA